ncbi:MAG: TrbC/VirB2 family protein [Elusimicrobia bacterium]|nr:TrbC/VirB2 family protein [Elusimicrobiota bacterium]
MSKRSVVVWLLVVGFVVAVGQGSAFAYGEQIESSLGNLFNWITKVLGGAAVLGGLIFTGIRVSMHDENAFKTGLKVIGGGIIIFAAKNIVDLLQAIFK